MYADKDGCVGDQQELMRGDIVRKFRSTEKLRLTEIIETQSNTL